MPMLDGDALSVGVSVVAKTPPSQENLPTELYARTRNPYLVPGRSPVTVF